MTSSSSVSSGSSDNPPFAEHPLYQAFTAGEPTTYSSPLEFSCRGCGHLCCVNTMVLVTPPETARITWYLRRHPQLVDVLRQKGIQWGSVYLGGSTGLPVMQLNFVPFDEQDPDSDQHCPFLTPVYENHPEGEGLRWLKMAWCGIREARPSVCRIFPVGRASFDAAHNERPEAWEYRIVARCPGFETAQPGEAVPPGYRPPDPEQTLAQWLEKQLDREQEREKRFYLDEVLPAFMQAGLHAPTEDNPDGRLPEAVALEVFSPMFYSPPPPPADTARDHDAIMAWLRDLHAQASVLERALSERETKTAVPSS